MQKHNSKNRYGLIAVALIAAIGLGVLGFNYASALNVPAATGPNDAPRAIMGATDFSGGIDLGAATVENGVPTDQPIPKFDGVNSSFWVNSNGPAQVPDDAVVHGIADSRGGFINTAQAQAAGPSQTPQPVYIYDDLWVKGNADPSEPGDLQLNGSIQNPDPLSPVTIDDGLNVGGDSQVSGSSTIIGNLHALNITAAQNIGRFYRRKSTTTTLVSGLLSTTASCGIGDILTGCNGFISGGDGILNGTEIDGVNCWGRGKPMNPGAELKVYATCFSPGGSIPTAPSLPTIQTPLP